MLITLLKQLREFEFGILSVFHLRGLGNWNLYLRFLSKWPHVTFHATMSSQTSPYDITDWSFSSVHIKFLGSHLHLTNALIFLSALFYFIVILMCLTSPDLMLFSVDFEFVAKIEVLCDTSHDQRLSDTEYKSDAAVGHLSFRSALYFKLRKSARS